MKILRSCNPYRNDDHHGIGLRHGRIGPQSVWTKVKTETRYSYWLVHAATNKKGETVKKMYGLEDDMAFFNLNKFLAGKFENCEIITQKGAGAGVFVAGGGLFVSTARSAQRLVSTMSAMSTHGNL